MEILIPFPDERRMKRFFGEIGLSDLPRRDFEHSDVLLCSLNDGLVSEHRAFFDEVMEWAEKRRDKRGSAFVLDR